MIEAQGTTKSRTYRLKPIVNFNDEIKLSHGLSEDAIWRFKILPLVQWLPDTQLNILQYGFTEMLNNAIDHSGSITAVISVVITYANIQMMVADNGIGIFQKIQNDFQLPDARAALFELSKGGITSDQENHAGEGIFFTSRMFNMFSLRSGPLFYQRRLKGEREWLIGAEDKPEMIGTCVLMELSTDATWTTAEVVARYRNDRERFRRTHVAIGLSAYPGEQLVSRSQAKRIVSRFDRFQEVILDFQGVEFIGQGFADEIFRIFVRDHPNVRLLYINVAADVKQMITHVTSTTDPDQFSLI